MVPSVMLTKKTNARNVIMTRYEYIHIYIFVVLGNLRAPEYLLVASCDFPLFVTAARATFLAFTYMYIKNSEVQCLMKMEKQKNAVIIRIYTSAAKRRHFRVQG